MGNLSTPKSVQKLQAASHAKAWCLVREPDAGNPDQPHPAHPRSSGTAHRQTPGCLPGRSCRTAHRSDSQVLPSLSRVTPSAASEHSSELIGCPISRSLTTSCVRLELRPLPSTGITRLHRYCRPLRHPKMPGPSLAGDRLPILRHTSGLPVLRTSSWCTCCRQYPGTATEFLFARSLSRISLPRKQRRVDLCIFRFEVCSAFTRVTACTLATSPKS